jgi:protein-disulfide isomerase
MDQKNNTLSVPMAILGAGILIAGALFFSQKGVSTGTKVTRNDNTPAKINLKPVSEADHILGDPNAPIVIVEYSDLECAFCKLFQPTVDKLVENYGKKGQVAWVYRHFPLEDLHPRAKKAALSSECVAELGGNTKFWSFVSKVFEQNDTRTGLANVNMSEIAKNLGVDQTKFDKCVADAKYDSLIKSSVSDGILAGVNGTPSSFLALKKALSKADINLINEKATDYIDPQGRKLVNIGEDGKTISLNGALPYEIFQSVIDIALATK